MRPWCKWLIRHNMRFVLYILLILLIPPMMFFTVYLPEMWKEVISTMEDIKSEDGNVF